MSRSVHPLRARAVLFALSTLLLAQTPRRPAGASVPVGGVRDFSGEWVLAVHSRGAFGLRLRQDGARLRGEHCANSWGARRIDGCAVEDVVGEVVGDVATVVFQGFRGESTGHARIVWYRGQIVWHVVESPDESWVPEHAWLRRGRAWWPRVPTEEASTAP